MEKGIWEALEREKGRKLISSYYNLKKYNKEMSEDL